VGVAAWQVGWFGAGKQLYFPKEVASSSNAAPIPKDWKFNNDWCWEPYFWTVVWRSTAA
jgi:hypothetical protein